MSSSIHARFCRLVELGGRLLAEVEIRTDDPKDPELVAFVERTGDGADPYNVRMIYRKDADYETDWYDNSLHQAYKEIKNDSSGKRNEGLDRLCEDAVRFGPVRADLDRAFHE